jgi:hypothetical protein
MFKETGECSFFIISTHVDFSSVFGNVESVTLVIFLIIYIDPHPTPKESGKGYTFNQ